MEKRRLLVTRGLYRHGILKILLPGRRPDVITDTMKTNIHTICTALYFRPQWHTAFVAKGIEPCDYEQEFYAYLLVQELRKPGAIAYLASMPGILYHSIKQRGLDLLKRHAAEILSLADDPETGKNSRKYLQAPAYPGPAAVCIVKEAEEKIALVLKQLSPQDRLILELRFSRSMSPRRIAVKLDKTVQEIYAAVDRAKRHLRKNVASHELQECYSILRDDETMQSMG